jgi:hypothetical protein
MLGHSKFCHHTVATTRRNRHQLALEQVLMSILAQALV